MKDLMRMLSNILIKDRESKCLLTMLSKGK
jgi:hypothetical protein